MREQLHFMKINLNRYKSQNIIVLSLLLNQRNKMKSKQGLGFFYENSSQNPNQFYDNLLLSEKFYITDKKLDSGAVLFDDDSQQTQNRVMKNLHHQNKMKTDSKIQSSKGFIKKKFGLRKQINTPAFQRNLFQTAQQQSQLNISEEITIEKDSRLQAFFNKSNQPKPKKHTIQQINYDLLPNQTPFNFNKKLVLTYPQTPHFKNKLQSPFWKFNTDHRSMIDLLKTNRDYILPKTKGEIIPVDPFQSPIRFIDQGPIKYFIGIAMKFKQEGLLAQARIFFKLACYVEPYNEKTWKKFIQFEQQHGCIYKAFILSKTAFLFTLDEQFGKMYLCNGDKCGIKVNQLYGILYSVNNPEIYEKSLLVDLAKLELKSNKNWREKGLKILSQICWWNDCKLPVCSIILTLAKLLQNYDHRDKALYLLKRSFNKSMSKLQIYTTYLQMRMRQQQGNTSQQIFQELCSYLESISGQNRYRLLLDIAEIYFKRGNKIYKKYILQTYQLAKKLCAHGTGVNKTLRLIYFTIAKWKSINPLTKIPKELIENDQLLFEKNRYKFISQGSLVQHQFSDWKYYLHYGLEKNINILAKGINKWPLTGRLVAEWIHCLRASGKKNIIEILAIWRKKIQEVPKSGQLWCQGGRIYAELQQYSNASKCFRSAIHFTPQYGDSFIQELRILLLSSRFHQIQKLKKLLFISEPFYGHVWSYLKLNHNNTYKLCLSQMWNNVIEEIKFQLYQNNIKYYKKNILNEKQLEGNNISSLLTAYGPYNDAFLKLQNPIVRGRLFISYEQMQNKN